MSDEDTLGTFCFIPRRIFVLLIAIGVLIYGVYNALYFVIFAMVNMTKLTPSHCSGPGCDAILTCDGTREATYHVRLAIMSIGCLFFGVHGVNAIQNKYASELYNFAWALVVAAIVYFSVMLMDGAYTVLCGQQYSYNVIMEAILWPGPGPVHPGTKFEIRQLNTYPVGYVNALCYNNVAMIFVALSMARVVFFMLAAYQTFELSQRFHYGLAGMGANFSIEGWRKRLMMRYEIDDMAYSTFKMAGATGMDLGWQEDEFHLQQPLRKPHWYRGMMPGGAAKAYDGFSDDRRNVLL